MKVVAPTGRMEFLGKLLKAQELEFLRNDGCRVVIEKLFL